MYQDKNFPINKWCKMKKIFCAVLILFIHLQAQELVINSFDQPNPDPNYFLQLSSQFSDPQFSYMNLSYIPGTGHDGGTGMTVDYSVHNCEVWGGYTKLEHWKSEPDLVYDWSEYDSLSIWYNNVIAESQSGRVHLRINLHDVSNSPNGNNTYNVLDTEYYYSFHYILDNAPGWHNITFPLVNNYSWDGNGFNLTGWSGITGNAILDRDKIKGFSFELSINGGGEGDHVSGQFILDNFTIKKGANVMYGSFVTKPGWNLVSVPLITDDMSVTTLYPSATSQAFEFNGSYNAVSTLENGEGYWIKFDGIDTIGISGTAPQRIIFVDEGWNLIGPFYSVFPTTSIITEPANIIASSFFKYDASYQSTNILIPFSGYWVKVNSPGVLILENRLLMSKSDKDIVHSVQGKISITDNSHNFAELFVAQRNSGGSYELPPAPPYGAFDVRFTDGTYGSDLNSGEQIISISGAEFPVQITNDGPALRFRDNINGELLDFTLQAGQKEIIRDSRFSALHISIAETPVAFDLFQNFPNPFNPTTKIKFSISGLESGQWTTLKIFDFLGSEIATLFEGIYDPGIFEVEFNAADLSSGVYFYRLNSGGRVITKKCLYLK